MLPSTLLYSGYPLKSQEEQRPPRDGFTYIHLTIPSYFMASYESVFPCAVLVLFFLDFIAALNSLGHRSGTEEGLFTQGAGLIQGLSVKVLHVSL